MTTKPAFPALDAPPALVHGRPCVEELVLPKSVESGNLSVTKVVIRWMSVNAHKLHRTCELTGDRYGHYCYQTIRSDRRIRIDNQVSHARRESTFQPQSQ
jgi:hypothetical protein